MEQAKDLQRRHTNESDKVAGDLADCNRAVGSLELELKTASFEYKFYQEMRGFVLDIVDCYNDKVSWPSEPHHLLNKVKNSFEKCHVDHFHCEI